MPLARLKICEFLWFYSTLPPLGSTPCAGPERHGTPYMYILNVISKATMDYVWQQVICSLLCNFSWNFLFNCLRICYLLIAYWYFILIFGNIDKSKSKQSVAAIFLKFLKLLSYRDLKNNNFKCLKFCYLHFCHKKC